MHIVVIYTSMVGKKSSVVRAVIRLGLGIAGIVFCFLAGVRSISSPNHLDRLWPIQPAIQQLSGCLSPD